MITINVSVFDAEMLLYTVSNLRNEVQDCNMNTAYFALDKIAELLRVALEKHEET